MQFTWFDSYIFFVFQTQSRFLQYTLLSNRKPHFNSIDYLPIITSIIDRACAPSLFITFLIWKRHNYPKYINKNRCPADWLPWQKLHWPLSSVLLLERRNKSTITIFINAQPGLSISTDNRNRSDSFFYRLCSGSNLSAL